MNGADTKDLRMNGAAIGADMNGAGAKGLRVSGAEVSA